MLRNYFQRVLEEYPNALTESFESHPLAEFLRSTVPEEILLVVEQFGYFDVKGSAGQGNWAGCPWLRFWIQWLLTPLKAVFILYIFSEKTLADFT